MSAVYYWQKSDPSTSDMLALACPHCEFRLTLHQPDPELSDRLLATCEECKSWYLANLAGQISSALPACPENRKSRGLTGYLRGPARRGSETG